MEKNTHFAPPERSSALDINLDKKLLDAETSLLDIHNFNLYNLFQ